MKYIDYDHLPKMARAIREKVFVDEQGFQEEFDSADECATHILAFDGEVAVATCRFFKQDNYYLIGRIAVLKDYRGKNIGRDMLRHAEESIKSMGGQEIRIHAQLRAQGFYEKLGYKPFGEYDYDGSCKHVWMKKDII
ncbi:MAG: GNAT family N-acetyltransferase [Clostridia bacterium]|nr:GNAT family N-acetyltransferase [Clostridia bacterium]